MAEPLTIVGGIAAILEISSTVVDLVKTVKDASTDRQKLLAEIHATTALCQTLKDYAEMDAVPWTKTFQILCSSNNGPIEQFQASLGCLQKKLAPGDKETSSGQVINAHAPVVRKMNLKSWGRSLKWPFTKDEVREILADIERQKSLFSIALTNDTLRLTAAISKGITHIIAGVDAIQENQQSEQRKQALANLSTIDFEAVHYDVSSRRASGTGQWLLKSTEFETWLNSSSNVILWCRGIPGAGKTIMSSLIIDHLRAIKELDPSTAVAGIYCTYRDPQTTANMLGSVSQQLAAGLDTLPRVLFKDQSLSSKIISEVLSEMMLSYQKIFFVIDALDECLSKLDLLKEIQKLLETGSSTLLSCSLNSFPAPTLPRTR